MKGTFRASTPADLPQISSLLSEAFSGSSGSPGIDHRVMAWKYWERREDWTEPRSYVYEKENKIVAHAGLWPVILLQTGRPMQGIQMIDWAAGNGSPGAGLAVLQKLSALCDFMYSIGGSDATRKLLPAFGFMETGRAWTAARPLRPVRQILTHQFVDWRLAPRLVRNWIWSVSGSRRGIEGWSAHEIDPSQLPAGFIPTPTHESPFSSRGRTFFEYLLRCPTGQFRIFKLSDHDVVKGHFVLGLVRGQARLGGVWLRNPCQDHWRIAFTLAQQVALSWRGAYEIAISGSEGPSAVAAAEAGLHVLRTTPVYVLNKGSLRLPENYQFQMIDDDAAFLDPGQRSYLT